MAVHAQQTYCKMLKCYANVRLDHNQWHLLTIIKQISDNNANCEKTESKWLVIDKIKRNCREKILTDIKNKSLKHNNNVFAVQHPSY